MDYEKAYKKALERARNVHKYSSDIAEIKRKEEIFPELKESENEKIRKEIMSYIKSSGAITNKQWIAWLEKQGEQKPADRAESMEHSYITPNPEFFQWIYNRLVYVHNENPNMDYMLSLKERIEDMQKSTDKVEPKFKVGDWVVTSYGKVNQVIAVDEDSDGFTLDDGTYFSGSWKDSYHLWSIEDAKQGDILYCESLGVKFIIILKCINQDGSLDSYCRYNTIDGFGVNIPKVMSINDDPKPATKEQRDLLFIKMNKSGYEWNNEKKGLLEIEEELTDFEKSLKHIMIETLECGDTRNLKADAEMLLRLAQEPKEWSEEDEANLNEALSYIKDDTLKEFIKSLRPRSKWKWSEEDESMYTRTLGVLGKCYMGQLPTKVEEELKWFKSLKQRIGG